MNNLEPVSEKLFAKIRGRFPSVTIGDGQGTVTDDPKLAKYFDFDYKEGQEVLGKVSITLDEDGVVVLYNQDFMAEAGESEKNNWYNFLKEIRIFAKKHMLNFDTRDITKSNLDKRDYAHLTRTAGETQMSESNMYGTSRTSFENIDTARLVLKHTKPVNQEVAGSRTQNVHSMYIESADGERFKYPFRHLNGARAMARHVSEGGNLYDDFGKHIVEMSTELNKLRKFKTYMNRSSVMAEGLKGYMEAVDVRLENIKTEVLKLQRKAYYTETFATFAPVVNENVPEDVAENWIDQLTIRTFNEELKDVFPYVYRLVSEVTTAKELSPEDLLGEGGGRDMDCAHCDGTGKHGDKDCNDCQGTGEAQATAEAEVQTPEMEFERHMDSIVGENDNALIDGDERQIEAAVKKINGLMSQHFPAGINGSNAIESMKGVIDDPMLLDMFKQVGQKDADTCVRPLVMKYLKGKNPAVMNKIDTGDLETESQYTKTVDKDDYDAKQKALQDLQMDPETSKDPELSAEIIKRKKALQKDADKYESTNEETEMSSEIRDKIDAWIEKYSKYKGGNGDTLPEGYMQWALNSGIATDFIETNEADAMEEKYGDEFDNDPWRVDFYNEMPITKACMEELEKITGDTDIDTNARMIDAVMNGDGNESTMEDAFDKADRITDMEELNLYSKEDIANNSQMSAEELKDALQQDIYHLMDKASDDFTDNDHIADEMGDYFANMHLKADDKTLSCYIAMRDLIDADPAGVYETGKKCLKILGAQEHQDQEQGNKGPKGRPAADAYAGGMESTNNELARIKELAGASNDDDTMDVKINSKGQMMHPNTPDDMDGEEGDDRTPGQKLEELVKSYYDYTTNNFPKGEQAVITACEKEFGENSVPVAEKMIGRLMAGQDNEMERIKSLAGINN